MTIDFIKAMNIEELSREVAYGATLNPLGYFKNNYSMLFSLSYKDEPERLYVIDMTYSRILQRYTDDIGGRIRRLQNDKNFSIDFELRVKL